MRKFLFVTLLVGFLLQCDAQRKKGAAGSAYPVQCPQFTAALMCKDASTYGKKYFDGCNKCRCSPQDVNVSKCKTLNECPTMEAVPDELKNKANKACARLLRKNGRKQRKQGGKARQTFNSCYNVKQYCASHPTGFFFDGCNTCNCFPPPNSFSDLKTFCTKKVCPTLFPFKGNQKQFKKHCRRVGAKAKRNREICVDGVQVYNGGKPCQGNQTRNRDNTNPPPVPSLDQNEFKAVY